MSNMKISVIITTYNRPTALERVLRELFTQTRRADEIIVADDGSDSPTGELVNALKERSPCRLVHCWQPDRGFRAASARNRAVASATGDYILFLDDDCIPLPSHIERHEQLARHGWFVAGNRVLLGEKLSHMAEHENLPITHWPTARWVMARLGGQANRLAPLMYRRADGRWREARAQQWEGVKTCNLGVWLEDFMAVNGFDEDYQGWGHEDADLAVRLIKAGIHRRDGRFSVPVLHLWHPGHDRSREAHNRERLQGRIDDPARLIRPERGVSRYLD